MKLALTIVLLSFGLLTVLKESVLLTQSAYANDGKGAGTVETRSVPGEPYKLKVSYHNQIVSLLKAKKYDELEKICLQVDADKKPLANGKPKCDYFFASFLVRDQTNDLDPTEADYVSMITMLTNWANARTKSAYARIALAFSYNDYAWLARGGGYSDTVSDNGWKVMAQRQNIALRLLDEARKLESEKLIAYELRLTMAKDSDMSNENYEKLFKEAITKFPKARSPYFIKVLKLQPRWGGEAGEWERFAQTSADNLKSVEGDEFYAQIVWAVDRTHWYYKENLFRNFKLDYARIKRGFNALQSTYPDSYLLLSEYCHVASLDGDKDAMKKLFAKLAGRVDKDTWWDETAFDYWKKYSEG